MSVTAELPDLLCSDRRPAPQILEKEKKDNSCNSLLLAATRRPSICCATFLAQSSASSFCTSVPRQGWLPSTKASWHRKQEHSLGTNLVNQSHHFWAFLEKKEITNNHGFVFLTVVWDTYTNHIKCNQSNTANKRHLKHQAVLQNSIFLLFFLKIFYGHFYKKHSINFSR